MRLKHVWVALAVLLGACNSFQEAANVERAAAAFKSRDKAQIYEILSEIKPVKLSCSTSWARDRIEAQVIEGFAKLLEFEEGGASTAQLVAIARYELKGAPNEIIRSVNERCENTVFPHEIKAYYLSETALKEYTVSQGRALGAKWLNSGPEIERMTLGYEGYRFNNRVNICEEYRQKAQLPPDQMDPVINPDEMLSALNCFMYDKEVRLPRDFKSLSDAARERLGGF